MRNIETLYQTWLHHPHMPRKLVRELKAMTEKAKIDAFYTDAEFGTAGMRGIMGAGTSRINEFTIRRAALGFGHYLLKTFADAPKRGVVIAYDNRHMNKEFMEVSSLALRSLGIKTFIFDELKPTPLLSFAVRHLKCVGGIMITASHNTKIYNGFKVYDETGAQLVPQKVESLLAEINALPSFLDIRLEEPKVPYALLSDNVEETYYAKVLKLQLRREQERNGFRIVFTPQHGAGRKLGLRALNFYNVIPVIDQMKPDPEFSHTKTLNPEEKDAYIEAVKYAHAHGAQLIIATDPDADRLGLVVKNKEGRFTYLTGNQTAALLLDYLIKTNQELGKKIKGKYLYTTIVSGQLASKIALKNGLQVKQFLTGFKYIGAQIAEDEAQGVNNFFFGYEESYGLLVGTFVRDKDAIQALVLCSEMALYYHLQGKSLDVVLNDLHEEYGYHLDSVKSIAFPGAEGQEQMQQFLTRIRENGPTSFAGQKVIRYEDYLTSMAIDGEIEETLTLPKSNVLRYELSSGTMIAIRPSGTEPKCKIYVGVTADTKKEAEQLSTLISEDLKNLFN